MRKNGPWTIKSSETKYENPWIKVVEDKVIQPNGDDGIFGTVVMVPGISVLPCDEEGNVYLTKEDQSGQIGECKPPTRTKYPFLTNSFFPKVTISLNIALK